MIYCCYQFLIQMFLFLFCDFVIWWCYSYYSYILFYARLLFKLPRVVPDQREKFETEDLFKKHTREGEVRYTLYRDRPNHERQAKFQAACRDGHTEIVSFYLLGVLNTWFRLHVHFPLLTLFKTENSPRTVSPLPILISPGLFPRICRRWETNLILSLLLLSD